MDVKINITMPSESKLRELLDNYINARNALQEFLNVDFCEEEKETASGN